MASPGISWLTKHHDLHKGLEVKEYVTAGRGEQRLQMWASPKFCKTLISAKWMALALLPMQLQSFSQAAVTAASRLTYGGTELHLSLYLHLQPPDEISAKEGSSHCLKPCKVQYLIVLRLSDVSIQDLEAFATTFSLELDSCTIFTATTDFSVQLWRSAA